MIVSIWRNLWRLSAGKKSTSPFTFSLRYCKDLANLLFWTLWACLAIQHPKWYYQVVENFRVYLQAKIQLHPSRFHWDIAKILQLVIWVLSACLAMYTQNDRINLQKTSIFICTPKINSIIWDWSWNINNNVSFHFRLFPGKTNDKMFQKIVKKILFSGHFRPFFPKFKQKFIVPGK